MKPLILASTLLLAATLLSSCHKNAALPSSLPGQQGLYLYVGGTNSSTGVYWKTSLSQGFSAQVPNTVANSTLITSILTSGSDVYMAGQTGGYWKNDSFVTVTGASQIQFMALSGSTVYTAGFDQSLNLAYWANNTENNLAPTIDRNRFPFEGVSTQGLSGIALSGSNVLVTGKLFFENEPGLPDTTADGNFALLWNNGSLQLLGPGVLISAVYPSTVGIAVTGNDVYVAGRKSDTTYPGGFWKNGNWNSINNGSFTPMSIAASGTNIYIPGYTYIRSPGSYSQQAAYWYNGNLIPLDGSEADAVAVSGSDAYILGVDNNNNIVVWKNSSLFGTLGTRAAYGAITMAIGN
jgi:hypothetical protein